MCSIDGSRGIRRGGANGAGCVNTSQAGNIWGGGGGTERKKGCGSGEKLEDSIPWDRTKSLEEKESNKPDFRVKQGEKKRRISQRTRSPREEIRGWLFRGDSI